jgi:hypothetical protein
MAKLPDEVLDGAKSGGSWLPKPISRWDYKLRQFQPRPDNYCPSIPYRPHSSTTEQILFGGDAGGEENFAEINLA